MDNDNRTLHHAALNGQTSKVKLQLEIGALVEAVDKDGSTKTHRNIPISLGALYDIGILYKVDMLLTF